MPRSCVSPIFTRPKAGKCRLDVVVRRPPRTAWGHAGSHGAPHKDIHEKNIKLISAQFILTTLVGLVIGNVWPIPKRSLLYVIHSSSLMPFHIQGHLHPPPQTLWQHHPDSKKEMLCSHSARNVEILTLGACKIFVTNDFIGNSIHFIITPGFWFCARHKVIFYKIKIKA